MKTVLIILTLILTLYANEAEEIIKKVDANMRGNDIYMKMTMNVVYYGHKRSMKMEMWGKSDKKSFVKVLYPPKDKGITFLSLNNQMWQYIPKIERIIKIPPSMMLQNWMGSDITNDDMARQSSIVDDYTPKILKTKENIVIIELDPKPNAAVVWGKIISNIDTYTYTSQKDSYFDEDGKEVRTITYKDVKKIKRYYLPTYWLIKPIDKKENYTEIIIQDVQYDTNITDEYFTKSALKRFSR
jgi:outer membrane lipoprotein-sorting protein